MVITIFIRTMNIFIIMIVILILIIIVRQDPNIDRGELFRGTCSNCV